MKDQNKRPEMPEDYSNIRSFKDPVSINIEEKWKEIKDEYRKFYPMLTERDLEYLPGQFDHMTDAIASKTQRCRSEVNNEIRYWNTNLLP